MLHTTVCINTVLISRSQCPAHGTFYNTDSFVVIEMLDNPTDHSIRVSFVS